MRALSALLLVGCTASTVQREACYAKADAVQVQRAMGECVDTGWTNCPAKPAIVAEAEAARKACP